METKKQELLETVKNLDPVTIVVISDGIAKKFSESVAAKNWNKVKNSSKAGMSDIRKALFYLLCEQEGVEYTKSKK